MSTEATVSEHQPKAAQAQGRLEELRQSAREATQAGDWKSALERWLRVAEKVPDEVEATGHVALAYKFLGKLDASLAYWHKALEISPESSGLLGNMAEIYRLQHKMDLAEAAARRALAIRPDRHEIRGGLATSLWDQRKLAEALAECAKIPEGSPSFGPIENLRGNIYSLLGDGVAARKAYANALKRSPDNALYHSNYLLSLLYDEALDPKEVFEAHRAFGRQYDQPAKRVIGSPDPCRKLRVGLLSSDFRLHSVAYFVEPLIEAIDRRRFEIVLYANVMRPDDMTDALRAHASAFVSINGYSQEQFSEQCEGDGIDILIDLNGHTGGNLLPFLSHHPAPVQISWLGYPYTTGMKSIAYRLSDAVIEPLEVAAPVSSEQIWHIEEGCHLYRMPGADVALNPLPLTTNGFPTLISCNNSAKISPTTLRVWATLLREVPDARLILKNSGYVHPPRQAEIVRFFEDNGVSASRIEFHQLKNSVRKHIELYHEADIALDTYPYNGTTTTCEALWMGLPVISMIGHSACSRHSASLLRQVGLADWVVESEEAYVAKVKAILTAPEVLNSLRSSLRDRLKLSPLGHSVHFAGRFQAALRRIWATACAASGADPRAVEKALDSAKADELIGGASLAVSRAQYYQKLGKIEEAADAWVAAALSGKVADACPHAAHCLEALGAKERRVDLWRQATSLYPERPEFWATRAELEVGAGHYDEAVLGYEKALDLSPDNPGVWMNLSAVLRSVNLPTRAEKAARKAIEMKPDFSEAWNNLGGARRDLGDFDGAVAAFCRALQLEPRNTTYHANLVYLLNFIPGLSSAELREQMRVFDQTQFSGVGERSLVSLSERAEDCLRIGFLSSDLRRHSVAYFLRAALPALQHSRLEVHVFADVGAPDDLSHELRVQADRWYWTSQLSDEALASHIRSLELDVLVELNGCTAGNRLAMLAKRVAPKQGSWLGFPLALECQGIDFFVSDKTIYPEAMPSLRLLEDCAFPFAMPAELPEVSPIDLDGPLVFGAFHNGSKLNAGVWAQWIRLLHHFEESRLLVKAKQFSDEAYLARLQSDLRAQGAPLERIDFEPYAKTLEEHLGCYRRVDLALDPSPYNGVTTTLEALAMGVPVFTIPGETPASRHAASLLKTYADRQGICQDEDDLLSRIGGVRDELRTFRAERSQRHEAFSRRIDAYRPVWAENFLKILINETKETRC